LASLWTKLNRLQVKPIVIKSEKAIDIQETIGRILKANSSWSLTRAKLCQLIASLSVVLSQLNLAKLKLEYLKSGFRCKKERYKHFCIIRIQLFSSSAQVCF